MNFSVTVGNGGRVTIPAEVRRAYALGRGSQFDISFSKEGDSLILTHLPRPGESYAGSWSMRAV